MSSLHRSLMLASFAVILLMAAPSISALAKDDTTAKQLAFAVEEHTVHTDKSSH